MKAHFDKDLRSLIEKSDYTKKQIADNLKIPVSTLENLMNGEFDYFSNVSLIDIAKRLSSMLGEEINVIFEDEELKEEVKLKTKDTTHNKLRIFQFLMVAFLIVNLIFLYFLIQDLRFYNSILRRNIYTLNIINRGTSEIYVNETVIPPSQDIQIQLAFGENLEIHGNQGETIIETPLVKYTVKLEDFEVSLSYGND
nr:XRE family transcriptional regulator [Petrotoga miotherma]